MLTIDSDYLLISFEFSNRTIKLNDIFIVWTKPMHCCSNLKKVNHFYFISSIIYLSCNVIWQEVNTIFSSNHELTVKKVPMHPENTESFTKDITFNFENDPTNLKNGEMSVLLFDYFLTRAFGNQYEPTNLTNLRFNLKKM